MKISLKLDAQAGPIFKRMAREGSLTPAELARVACLNLIAIWVKDHGIKEVQDGVEVSVPPV